MACRKVGSSAIYVLTLFAGIIIVILFAFCILYVQITATIMSVKNDIYLVAQNGIVANNKDELAIDRYTATSYELKKYISEILNRNYIKTGSSITSFNIRECWYVTDRSEVMSHTGGKYTKPIIHIKLIMTFTPVIKVKGISRSLNIPIHQDVKANLLNYGG